MAVFRPFRGIRPKPALSAQVAALPYDTMSSAEARVLVRGKPLSFLHIDMAEIDLPADTDPYGDLVYETAAANLRRAIAEGVFVRDEEARFYIYRQTWRGRTQTGLVGCASIDDYRNDVIKKHELTHPHKEIDRIKHVTACNANTGPIFLLYRDTQGIAALLDQWCAVHACESGFEGPGGAWQEIWPVTDPALAKKLQAAFKAIPALYIADGHHRCASAAHVGFRRRQEAGYRNQGFTGEEEFNFFLGVAFPSRELAILDFNRAVKDLNGLTAEAFLSRVENSFLVEPMGPAAYRPEGQHFFGMFLDGVWYKLRARRGTFDAADPVLSLDVEILQRNLLAPILGIKDPRRDHRVEFIGGIRGLEELERRCGQGAGDRKGSGDRDQGSGDMRVAFAMYPTTVDELMAIADKGDIMPPKSTWFEPKLLSGLFIHELE